MFLRSTMRKDQVKNKRGIFSFYYFLLEKKKRKGTHFQEGTLFKALWNRREEMGKPRGGN